MSSKIIVKCEYCDIEFETSKARREKYGSGRFCSRECFYASKVKQVERKCEICGITFMARAFKVKNGGGRYCSRKCFYISQRTRIHRKCEHCGAGFDAPRNEVDKGKGRFCSMRCYYDWRIESGPHGSEHPRWNSTGRECKTCGAKFYTPMNRIENGRGNFCSRKCFDKWKKIAFAGSGNPCWRGGTSSEPYGIEWTDELRGDIRERDKHICAVCRRHGVNVHHIDYCKENNTPDNLVTMCSSCHGATSHNREYWQQKLNSIMQARIGLAGGGMTMISYDPVRVGNW